MFALLVSSFACDGGEFQSAENPLFVSAGGEGGIGGAGANDVAGAAPAGVAGMTSESGGTGGVGGSVDVAGGGGAAGFGGVPDAGGFAGAGGVTDTGGSAGTGVAGSGGFGAAGAPTSVLASAEAFAVLGASTVTNADFSLIDGDVGVSPGTATSGFPPQQTIHSGDPVAAQAQLDLTAAYNALAAKPCEHPLTGTDLGGLTLTPGVYCFSTSAALGSALVLDAQNDPNATFIFQIGSTFVTTINSTVTVINGGSDCNVYWNVGSSATLSGHTTLAGNVLAMVSITAEKLTTVSGRVLARTGAVTLDANTVSNAICNRR